MTTASLKNFLSRHKFLLPDLIVIVFSFVLYGNTIMFDYAFDDAVVVQYNVFTQKGIKGIPEIFSYDTFVGSTLNQLPDRDADEVQANMKELAGEPMKLRMLDENGKDILAGDEDRRYFEDPWMHKMGDTYYFSYSTGTTHYLVYGTSKSPTGPFTYRGRILEPVIGWTTHHSIVEYNGKWYLFYHDSELSGGVDHLRCVKYTELHFNADGTIQTIKPYEE